MVLHLGFKMAGSERGSQEQQRGPVATSRAAFTQQCPESKELSAFPGKTSSEPSTELQAAPAAPERLPNSTNISFI